MGGRRCCLKTGVFCPFNSSILPLRPQVGQEGQKKKDPSLPTGLLGHRRQKKGKRLTYIEAWHTGSILNLSKYSQAAITVNRLGWLPPYCLYNVLLPFICKLIFTSIVRAERKVRRIWTLFRVKKTSKLMSPYPGWRHDLRDRHARPRRVDLVAREAWLRGRILPLRVRWGHWGQGLYFL